VLKPTEKRIEFMKEKDNVIYSLPYYLASDTIQRMVLHHTAMITNHNAAILLEEPESHAFPFYTKILAETISRNIKNQFFLTTHNPYFLLTLIEKTPVTDLAVFLVEMKDYQTKAILLTERDLQEFLDKDIDIFFNLGSFSKLF